VRVAVVADGSAWGGAQVYARSLVRHAPPGVMCTVVSQPQYADRFEGEVVTAPSCVGAPADGLVEVLQQLQPDLVQLNLVDPASMVTALEAVPGPVVATLHMRGVLPDLPRLRAAYARLRALVAVSAEFAELARTRLGRGDVVHVVNGVDPLPVLTPPGGDPPVVGALGRLTAQKGFDVLLDALRLLPPDSCRLLLAGEGRKREALQDKASGLPVDFLGATDGPLPLLERCDVFALSSRVEALPLVLVEAVSAGLPAVATDVGDVRLALGDVVRVVPPEDPSALAEALQGLLVDPEERRWRGVVGAARAREQLTAERMARQAWDAFLR
jgi:glycosyltransferase involved in cell wall biosynthesis